MKKLILIASIYMMVASSYGNPTCTPTILPQPGFSPALDQLPCFTLNKPNNLTISFHNFKTIVTTFGSVTIDTLIIDSVNNLPNGMTVVFNQSPALYLGDSSGCMTLDGIPTGTCGQYRLGIYVRAFVKTPNPIGSGFLYFTLTGRSDSLPIPVIGGTQSLFKAWARTTDSCSGCNALDTNSTAYFQASKCGISIMPHLSQICSGAKDTLTATPGYLSYTWVGSTGGATTNVNIVTAAGQYIVTGVFKAGCVAQIDTATVATGQNVAKPHIVSSIPPPNCLGQSTTLSVVAGNFDFWNWTKNGSPAGASPVLSASTTGNYIVLVKKNGYCGSASDTISLTFNPLPSCAFTASGAVLTATTTGAGTSYQWFKGTTPINGAVSGTYTATVSASYSVQVTQNGCACSPVPQSVTVAGLNDIANQIQFAVSPNPTTGKLHLSYELGNETIQHVFLTDLQGRKVLEVSAAQPKGTISMDADISSLNAGMYMIQFVTTKGTANAQIIKE